MDNGDEWGRVASVSIHPEDCSPSVPQPGGRGLPWCISCLGEVLYSLVAEMCLWLERCCVPVGLHVASRLKSTVGSVPLALGFEWGVWLLGALCFLCLLTFQMVLEISLVDQNRRGTILDENLILLLSVRGDYILQHIFHLLWALEQGVEEKQLLKLANLFT